MKKIIIALTIWLCLCSPCFATIDENAIHDNYLCNLSFTTRSFNDIITQINNLAEKSTEISYIQYYWHSDGSKIDWDIEINWRPSVKILTGQQLTKSDQQIKEAAENIVNSIDKTNDYQTIYEIYNWIQDKTEYDYISAKQKRYLYQNLPCDNAGGVFFDGKAVCGGYADAFYLLSNMAGIDCFLVIGGNHCWNIVKLQDKWYYIDVTDENGHCFLRGSDWLEEYGYVIESYMPVEASKTDYMF